MTSDQNWVKSKRKLHIILLLFLTMYLCKSGDSALTSMKNKYKHRHVHSVWEGVCRMMLNASGVRHSKTFENHWLVINEGPLIDSFFVLFLSWSSVCLTSPSLIVSLYIQSATTCGTQRQSYINTLTLKRGTSRLSVSSCQMSNKL